MIGAPLPAQVPGGPELLIVLLIGVLVFGVPLLLLLGGLGLWRANSNKEERIADLEQRIADLERGRGQGDEPAHDGGAATDPDPAAGRDESATE